ncbi:MAG: prenyltransferase [Spirochaetia bacterium]
MGKLASLINKTANYISQLKSVFRDKGLAKRFLKGWWHAFRAPSLIIAFVSCFLGIALAYSQGHSNDLHSFIIIIAGLLIQSGVNLMNDFYEYHARNIEDKIPHLKIEGTDRDVLEWSIFLTGVACFLLTIPLGLFLVYRTGWELLILGIIGFIGGYGYTGEPFNYKRKGLGVVFVFFLMGVFMVTGSYFAIARHFTIESIIISLPISTLVSHILLSNEVRDYEYDLSYNHKTLAYRIGYPASTALYFSLFAAAYIGTFVLWAFHYHPAPWFVLIALPFTIAPIKNVYKTKGKRAGIIPAIMIHHGVFGISFTLPYLLL